MVSFTKQHGKLKFDGLENYKKLNLPSELYGCVYEEYWVALG